MEKSLEIDRKLESKMIARKEFTRRATSYYVAKRFLDLLITVPALFLLIPLMLLIALLIRIDTPGATLFRQIRIGVKRRTRNGETIWEPNDFICYKFRTMVNNSNPSIHKEFVKRFVQGKLDNPCKDEELYKLNNDSRVTRIGHILRATSLDELPQLFNVLIGQMSLVGPRPDVPYAVKYYEDWHQERLTALPGLTGLWQVRGRCKVTFDEMARMDIDYIRNQSLSLDIKLIILTIPAVLSRRGAV